MLNTQNDLASSAVLGLSIPPHVLDDIKANLYIPTPTDEDAFCEEIQYVGIDDDAERNALIEKYKEQGQKSLRENRAAGLKLEIAFEFREL